MINTWSGARVAAVAALAMLGTISVAPAVQAQFGGLIKRAKDKVEQAAAEKSGAADSTAAQKATAQTGGRVAIPIAAPKSPLGPYVKEFTPEMLEHAYFALDAEQRQAARQKHREAMRRSKEPSEMDKWQACFQKAVSEYQGNQKKIDAKCGTVAQVQERQQARDKAEADHERALGDSLRVSIIATPDSAGAVAGGFGSERAWGTVKERITAFLLLDANGTKAQCMRNERLQYIFTDAESDLLRQHRTELAKRFLDPELVKDAVWGRCRKA